MGELIKFKPKDGKLLYHPSFWDKLENGRPIRADRLPENVTLIESARKRLASQSPEPPPVGA